METRANYVIVGAFTVLFVLAGLGFFLWLGKVQLDRVYAHYDVLFDSVAGLGQSSPVRFNGVDVGSVQTIRLDRANPSRVRVRIEVVSGTPVREGTVATLASQGVTGVSFVALEGGRADAPRLLIDDATGVALIPSKNSVVQGLMEDAPDLLNEAIALLRDLKQFTNDENRTSIANILKNVDEATGRLDKAMSDFAEISDSAAVAVEQVKTFTLRLDTVAANADTALVTANRTLESYNAFAGDALPRISATTTEASKLLAALTKLTTRIERDPARFFLGNQTPEYSR